MPSQAFLNSSRKTRHCLMLNNSKSISPYKTCRALRFQKSSSMFLIWPSSGTKLSKTFSLKISLAFPIYFLVYFLIRNFLDWIKNSPQFFLLFDLVFYAFMHSERRERNSFPPKSKLPAKQKNYCLSFRGLAGFIISLAFLICITRNANKQKEGFHVPAS